MESNASPCRFEYLCLYVCMYDYKETGLQYRLLGLEEDQGRQGRERGEHCAKREKKLK